MPFGIELIAILNNIRLLGKSTEVRFTNIYKKGGWGSDESVSGAGSTLQYTENIRKEIPAIIRKLNVTRVFDAPCGDFNWFRFMELPKGVHYVGGDIVQELIINNQKKYGTQSTVFHTLDIIKDELPDADLWICRDALMHLSNAVSFL
jgi:hypothetical protein